MRILHDAISKVFDTVPQLILSKLIREKLAAQKIELSPEQLNKLVARVLNDEASSASLVLEDGGPDRTISLEFTSDDAETIERRGDKFIETLPKLIEDVASEATTIIMARLKEQWPQEAEQEQEDIDGFRERLYERWGDGLDGLRMLVAIAREFGSNFSQERQKVDRQYGPVTVDVLVRLHARACQVAAEVICLLENGFADGAIARWRTLHEIAIVSLFISEHGEDLAERYVAHEIVETSRVVWQFGEYGQRLGLDPISDNELAEIKKQRAAAIDKYGSHFKGQYGWAAKHLNKKEPSIADIRKGSQIDHLAPYYRFASHNVHANAKGIYFKLGLIGPSNVLLSGPSNAGLADPGHATAQSLLQVSAALLCLSPILDNIVTVKIMDLLTGEIGTALFAAHKKQIEECHPTAKPE